MTQITLTNTLTRTKEPFLPRDEKNVRMYVCGITPYDEPHIGNARVMVTFDVLYRLLRHTYGANHVTYASNFTDIDDKIINRARENNEQPSALAERIITSFHHSMAALGVLTPNHEPRVSTYIPQIVKMVDDLVASKMAYITPSGDVMYSADKFADFGKLANRDLAGQQAGARVAADGEKQHEHDFVLWKANAKSATKMEQAFNPAGHGAKNFSEPGRPGWHIECSAMSRNLFGDTFDIHGGGEDLKFPHHSCEIAQTEALTHQPMCTCWMHVAFITVGGKRMGKSEGNFTTIVKALEDHPAMAIRYWFLQTHYRKPVDFTPEAVQAAAKPAARITAALTNGEGELPEEFLAALADDLNTAKALAILNKTMSDKKPIGAMAALLGLA